ncbi:MAG: serine/threonine protein kinase [Labilithrix sp.]|nr:serine/threonine protein kinase [Labilithrix sp.]MCW5810357.1 serine/threonine protein kinase [Labilithrix sp.]
MAPRVIAGRFELTDRIGRGAMGEVWGGRDQATGREVAIKIAQTWSMEEPELVDRFEREAVILRRLKSPYICKVIDAGRLETGVPFIVLEKLEGETLERLLQREHWLSLAEVGRIGGEILEGLVVAHAAGIVHRDLSPANVFLHEDGKSPAPIAKLIDFGVAKSTGAGAPRTTSRATMGTLPFVAPEQLGDSAKAGPRADLYAVGTIVFHALTGRLPYGDATGTRLVTLKREHEPPTIDEATGEKWPAALKTFLAKTIARTPSKRYASAEVALAALQQAARGRGPALAIPESPEGATATLTMQSKGPRGKR